MAQTLRERCQNLHASLKKERASWDSHWQEIDQYIRPRRSRFLSGDKNKGSKKNGSIYHSGPSQAVQVAGAGMAAGISSPARPWFRLTTREPQLAEVGSVRLWLHQTEELIRSVYARSNFYNSLAVLYPDLAQFGTQLLWIDEDPESYIRAYNIPVGQFTLALDGRMRVSTVTRETTLNVEQLVDLFGLDKVSPTVRQQYQNGDYHIEHVVLHCLMPNRQRAAGRADVAGKPWVSVWLEQGGDDREGILRLSGFDEFPCMAPRWATLDGDAYGWGPGMSALGDCKELQLLAKRKLNAIDKFTDPAVVAPSNLRAELMSMVPGAVNYVDSAGTGQAIYPIQQINPAGIKAIRESIEETVYRIREVFFAYLFLMMSHSDRRQVTAEEIRARQEEKMMQLGPVLEGLHTELHSPAIDMVFNILWRRGAIPQPPKELEGEEIRVEYVSILAQAQRALGIGSVERLASFTMQIAAVDPGVIDKLNTDELIDEMADRLGTKPDLVRPDEQVAQIRAARAKEQQAKEAAEAMAQVAGAARNLGNASVGPDSALGALLNSGAYGPPTGGAP